MDLSRFFESIRTPLFDGRNTQAAVDGIEAILPAFRKWGDGDVRKLAYILATAHHETGRFRWLREIWGPTAAQRRYEGRADLGNTVSGDGRRFMGRGFVHITGRHNYTDWSTRLDIDLIGNPALAELPEVASQIIVEGMFLGTFTGHGLSRYINASSADYEGARRVVNHTDQAALIAGYARHYESALRTAGWNAHAEPDIELPEAAPTPALRPDQEIPMLKPSPMQQVSKALGGAQGAGEGVCFSTGLLLLAAWGGYLPQDMDAIDVVLLNAALSAVAAPLIAFVRSYRAPKNAE